jgi:hypothetical protein
MNQCSICIEAIEETNSATMVCGHQFHYKCIFKWNLTKKGHTCPLCRNDLELPKTKNTDLTQDLIEIASTNVPLQINQQKKMLTKIVQVNNISDTGFSITCNTCSRNMHSCNFCDRPFCACRDTNGFAHFPSNPFNKFNNTQFDHTIRDDDMIRVVDIQHPFGDDLLTPRVCGCCFNNRDTVLSQTMVAISPGGIFLESIFNKAEIKIIYYSLFFDNSGVNNDRLRTTVQSYQTYDVFKRYIMVKFGIQPIPRPRLQYQPFFIDSSQSTI